MQYLALNKCIGLSFMREHILGLRLQVMSCQEMKECALVGMAQSHQQCSLSH